MEQLAYYDNANRPAANRSDSRDQLRKAIAMRPPGPLPLCFVVF